jgi:hypothetical protein
MPEQVIQREDRPAGNNGGYVTRFSELGRPPAFDGKTALTIGPREKRVLLLPAVELGVGEKLETVVTLGIQSRAEGKRLKIAVRDQLICVYAQNVPRGKRHPPRGRYRNGCCVL